MKTSQGSQETKSRNICMELLKRWVLLFYWLFHGPNLFISCWIFLLTSCHDLVSIHVSNTSRLSSYLVICSLEYYSWSTRLFILSCWICGKCCDTSCVDKISQYAWYYCYKLKWCCMYNGTFEIIVCLMIHAIALHISFPVEKLHSIPLL